MNPSDLTQPDARGGESTRKRPYHPPKLVNYGLIRDLTKGLSGTADESSKSPSPKMP